MRRERERPKKSKRSSSRNDNFIEIPRDRMTAVAGMPRLSKAIVDCRLNLDVIEWKLSKSKEADIFIRIERENIFIAKRIDA